MLAVLDNLQLPQPTIVINRSHQDSVSAVFRPLDSEIQKLPNAWQEEIKFEFEATAEENDLLIKFFKSIPDKISKIFIPETFSNSNQEFIKNLREIFSVQESHS